MSSRKSTKRILNPGILSKDFDEDIEEAKSLRDIERLEKKDSQLWFLAIFVILLLTLFIVVVDISALNLSPREMLEGLISLRLSVLIVPAAILLLAFSAYIFSQKRKFGELRRQIFIHKVKLERARGSMEEVVALAQISSAINNHKVVAL